MSLRDQLKRAVASCAPIETQPATSAANDATTTVTPAQLIAANPRQARACSATGGATSAQPPSKQGATFIPPENPKSCAAIASELTAHRVMKQLLDAAMRACDHWNDSVKARDDMRRECLAVPAHLRSDLRDHFERTYPKGAR